MREDESIGELSDMGEGSTVVGRECRGKLEQSVLYIGLIVHFKVYISTLRLYSLLMSSIIKQAVCFLATLLCMSAVTSIPHRRQLITCLNVCSQEVTNCI